MATHYLYMCFDVFSVKTRLRVDAQVAAETHFEKFLVTCNTTSIIWSNLELLSAINIAKNEERLV